MRQEITFQDDTANSRAMDEQFVVLSGLNRGHPRRRLSAAHRAQAHAREIEAGAKRRLAHEYDAAQERSDIATRADGPAVRDHVPGKNKIATAADVGVSRKENSRSPHHPRRGKG